MSFQGSITPAKTAVEKTTASTAKVNTVEAKIAIAKNEDISASGNLAESLHMRRS